MASRAATSLFDAGTIADRWVAEYRTHVGPGDLLADADGADRAAWGVLLEELASAAGESLDHARERAQRQAEDIGLGYRVPGDTEERAWPLSPIPLLIGVDEWAGIAAGMTQRAELMERIAADLYGPGQLVADGIIPAALLTGSPLFLRPLVSVSPPGGHHLHFYAADLCRDPSGEWRVLADHLRAPAGAGYALENRLAISRTLESLQSRLNVERHAPFFAALRDGLAAACRRSEPRIGILTPGKFNPSYAEQAHLARYLGFLLVEGGDLAVRHDQLYVRTIAGLKRIDALWRRVDPRMLDPLALNARSTIGVPGLIDAMAAGNVVISNAPGVGMLEAPAFAAFLPTLAERLCGEPLKLPTIATWWCGQPQECAHVLASLDTLLIAPAFGAAPLGLPGGAPALGAHLDAEQRAELVRDLARRPQDYVGQEVVRLSTTPLALGDRLAPRPFTLRVFAARDASGGWVVLPGGFARIGDDPDARAAVMGEGHWSADVCIHGPEPVAQLSLLPAIDSVQLRRNPGTLPSRVADNMFWLGRYLERGEALLALVRVLLGHSITADTGAALPEATVERLIRLVTDAGAAPVPASRSRRDLLDFARTALESAEGGWHNVRAINRLAGGIGAISRDRLSADMLRLLDAPHPERGSVLERAGSLQRRYAALAGLSAEHMVRTDAWRFQDLGRRVERGAAMARAAAIFVPDATVEDLSTLLDVADSQISYRQRYVVGLALVPVVDLVTLDPCNPRSIAFQVGAIGDHLDHLPVLSDSGVAEPQQRIAAELQALIATTSATDMKVDVLRRLEGGLTALSSAIATRYFLQGAEPLRGAGLTLA